MGLGRHARRVSPRVWFYFRSLRYRFYNGEPEIQFVGQLLGKGKLAIDVGSSIGLYSRELAKYATKVVAFEANPKIAAFARLVAPRNVEVFNIALSSAEGEMALRIPFNRRNNTIDDLATIEPKNPLQFDRILSEKVVTKRLDDFGFSDCGFIKLDVEGHEEAVLDGAMHLIETQRPVLMIELYERFNAGIISRVTSRLSNLRYGAYRLVDGSLRPLADFRPQAHSNTGYNFIFVPHEAKSRVLINFRAA